MPQFLGQNPDEVDTFASELTESARALEGIIALVDSRLRDTTWVGSDRTRFEGQWVGLQAAQLADIALSLATAASVAGANAAEQRVETDELYH